MLILSFMIESVVFLFYCVRFVMGNVVMHEKVPIKICFLFLASGLCLIEPHTRAECLPARTPASVISKKSSSDSARG